MKEHEKPTGSLNLYRISAKDIQAITTHFSKTKSEQEFEIAKLFVDIRNKNDYPLTPFELTTNKENDIDFTLTNQDEQSLLELTELVPSPNMKGGVPGSWPKGRPEQISESINRNRRKEIVKIQRDSTPH